MGCMVSNKLELGLLSDEDLARCVWDVLHLQRTGEWPNKIIGDWLKACVADLPPEISDRQGIALVRLKDAVFWRFYERVRQEKREDLPHIPAKTWDYVGNWEI